MKLINTLQVNNELGEGVIWDHQSQRIWWTDIQQSRLYSFDPETEHLQDWQTPERLCCFAPVENESGLAAAFESGFAFYQPETAELQWIKKLEQDNPATRFNDGRTDRQGRLWSATMTEKENAPYKGSLYCLDADQTIRKTIGDLTIPNSLCWSPDGTVMYHTDTPQRRIYRYAFNPESGEIGGRELLVETEPGCFPDGSIVDAEGYLWNAQWGGSKVVRYSPDGETDLQVDIPTAQPSCVAFGGKDLDLLIVTSAWQDMTDEQREADPNAGNLFIYQAGVSGLIERGYKRS